VRVARQRVGQLGDQHHPVAVVEQVELHRVQPDRVVGPDHDVLVGAVLQVGQRPPLLVVQVERDVVADAELGPDDLGSFIAIASRRITSRLMLSAS
jgi:hypothetical protein